MGLLDWLTDLGSTSGSMLPASQMNPPPEAPPHSFQRPEFARERPFPQGGDPMTAGGAPDNGPGLPPQPPVTQRQSPMAFPGAGGLPPDTDGSVIPPGATSTEGVNLPGAPSFNAAPKTSFVPNDPPPVMMGEGAAGMNPNPGIGRGFLGQAFGMSDADERKTIGGLGAGLKSVGENWNKPGLAAFAGSAGSAMQGGEATEQQRVDNLLKQVVAKRKAGDDSLATTLAMVKLETAKMQLENQRAGGRGGKSWNKPPAQLYQDAMKLVEGDRDVSASQKALEETIKGGDPKAIAAAQAEHKILIEAAKDKHLVGVGLNPQSAGAMAKIPGLTQANPIPQSDFANNSPGKILKAKKVGDKYVSTVDYDQFFVDQDGKLRVLQGTKQPEAATSSAVAPASDYSSPADAADEVQ